MKTESVGPVQPWWRIRMVWVAFGGPAVVVVACLLTLFLAVRGRDIPLAEMGSAEAATGIHHGPAERARNHVATPTR